MPDFILPFGPLHIVFLHLPIGGVFAIWFVLLVLKNDGEAHRTPALGHLHLFLIVSTLLTIGLGLVYEVQGQYKEELELHELWGYIFGGLVLLNYVFYWWHRKVDGSLSKYSYLLSLAAASVAMTITAHQGGELVHGKGFLTNPFQASEPTTQTIQATIEMPLAPAVTERPAPPMVESTSATAAVSNPFELYQAAELVLQNHCYSCHGATKQKGDLRLDNPGSAMTPGKSGEASIVAHDATASLLIQRMQLPRDHDDAMPPSNKAPVASENIAAVIAWIEAGAHWPDPTLRSQRVSTFVEMDDTATQAWIDAMNASGAKAEYNAWDDPRIRVDLSFTDAEQLENTLQNLDTVVERIIWLDLSSLEIPETFFERLPQFKNLERLHLDGTNISDAQLMQLSSLTQLNYLNLFDTQISNASIPTLGQFPKLKKVFLAQTSVTKAGAQSLAKMQPELEVIHR